MLYWHIHAFVRKGFYLHLPNQIRSANYPNVREVFLKLLFFLHPVMDIRNTVIKTNKYLSFKIVVFIPKIIKSKNKKGLPN